MAISDLAFQALLNFQAERARQPLPVEVAAAAIPQTLATIASAVQQRKELALKQREAELRYGTPARVRAPLFGGGARPGEVRIMPRMAGAVPRGPGIALEEDIPSELLTGRARRSLDRGGNVFYTPGRMGLEEFKARADTLPYLAADDTAALLTLPDREQAFKNVKPKVRAGNTTFLPVTDDMRKRAAATYGYDVLEGLQQIPVSSFNTMLSGSGAQERQKTREAAARKRVQGASLADLNRLADDLRSKLLDDANYVIRLEDDERAGTQELLNLVMQRQIELLMPKPKPEGAPKEVPPGSPATAPKPGKQGADAGKREKAIAWLKARKQPVVEENIQAVIQQGKI